MQILIHAYIYIHSFIQWAECLFMSQAHRTKGPHKTYNVAPSQIETKLKTDNCYEGGVQSRLQMPLWVWGNGAPRKWQLSWDAQKDLSRQKEEQRWDPKVGDMAGGAQQRVWEMGWATVKRGTGSPRKVARGRDKIQCKCIKIIGCRWPKEGWMKPAGL